MGLCFYSLAVVTFPSSFGNQYFFFVGGGVSIGEKPFFLKVGLLKKKIDWQKCEHGTINYSVKYSA